MRGKVILAKRLNSESRITPACAGKRGVAVLQGLKDTDHPRLCGEKSLTTRCMSLQGGSPPLVRGKAYDVGDIPAILGITPACAGKSKRQKNIYGG